MVYKYKCTMGWVGIGSREGVVYRDDTMPEIKMMVLGRRMGVEPTK